MHKPFRQAVIVAGLDPKRVTPQDVRHAAITNPVKAGVDLQAIQRIAQEDNLARNFH